MFTNGGNKKLCDKKMNLANIIKNTKIIRLRFMVAEGGCILYLSKQIYSHIWRV